MVPLIARLGLSAIRFLGKTSLFGGAVTGAGLLIAGSSEKDGPVQNFLTDAFSVVATSQAEAAQEASWQSFYKFMYKASELMISLGLDKYLKPLGIDLQNIQEISKVRMVEDTTTRPNVTLTESEALTQLSDFYQEAIKPREPSMLESAWNSVADKTYEVGSSLQQAFTNSVEATKYYLSPEPNNMTEFQEDYNWNGPTPWVQ